MLVRVCYIGIFNFPTGIIKSCLIFVKCASVYENLLQACICAFVFYVNLLVLLCHILMIYDTVIMSLPTDKNDITTV